MLKSPASLINTIVELGTKPHHSHPTVEILEGVSACGACLLRKALTSLLLHNTGTGTLTMEQADLEEVGEFNLEQLTITVRLPQKIRQGTEP